VTADQRAMLKLRKLGTMRAEGHAELAEWAEDQLVLFSSYWTDTQLTAFLAAVADLADMARRQGPHTAYKRRLASREGERLGGGLTAAPGAPGAATRPFTEQRLPGLVEEPAGMPALEYQAGG
jgi:hypothetical protein